MSLIQSASSFEKKKEKRTSTYVMTNCKQVHDVYRVITLLMIGKNQCQSLTFLMLNTRRILAPTYHMVVSPHFSFVLSNFIDNRHILHNSTTYDQTSDLPFVMNRQRLAVYVFPGQQRLEKQFTTHNKVAIRCKFLFLISIVSVCKRQTQFIVTCESESAFMFFWVKLDQYYWSKVLY